MTAARELAGEAGSRLLLDEACTVAYRRVLERCTDADAAARVWGGDHTLWKPGPAEIANRLGWLRAPAATRAEAGRIARLAREVREEGTGAVLLLGMGGSSLAPELFAGTFGAAAGHPAVTVLDSTDPAAVRAADERHPPERTLYLVSTKSGGTVETLSFFKYFHARAAARLGAGAGRRFVAITDPGSSLEAAARALGAREVFLNDPDVGGRYSALTLFGMVPAALCGVEVGRLLEAAEAMAARCRGGGEANPGLALGALAGGLALAGRDKLTLCCSPGIAGFGAWAEQLIAESTGKEGKGIVPVDGEPLDPGARYGADRLFVFLLLEGDRSADAAVDALAAAGHPVLALRVADRWQLGAELFRWEFATAVMGFVLGVNPFDQPDVEAAKIAARRALAAFGETGALPAPAGEVAGDAAAAAILGALERAAPGGYVAVQAFLDPAACAGELRELAVALRRRSGFPVTVGHGPRFLHSTGQLHKGGPPGGLFVQLVGGGGADLAIPDDFGSPGGAIGFGVLEQAQSLGDLRALEEAGRRVVRVNLGDAAGCGAALRELARAIRA